MDQTRRLASFWKYTKMAIKVQKKIKRHNENLILWKTISRHQVYNWNMISLQLSIFVYLQTRCGCFWCNCNVHPFSIIKFQNVRKRASLILFRLRVTKRVNWRQLWLTNHTIISEFIIFWQHYFLSIFSEFELFSFFLFWSVNYGPFWSIVNL